MDRDTPRSRKAVINTVVGLSLAEFTTRLARVFGCQAEYKGPGSITPEWTGDTPRLRRFAVDHLFGEIFSKFDDEKSSLSKWDSCLEKFFEAEGLCKATNERFIERSFLYQGNLSPGYTASKAMWLARRKIEWLLGEYSDELCIGYMGFGPGATTRLGRRSACLPNKLGGIPQATVSASSFAWDILPAMPAWHGYLKSEGAFCEIVEGNKLVSVPKNYKTDRMIAIEPDWNMFLQKGIGGYIRRRLRKVGIDLSDQSANGELARLGSLDGSYGTIDLSMASDTVSLELVRFLLPADWYDALEQCRSPIGFIAERGEQLVRYAKFSSMGNGYTFELETLIFWALSQSVTELMGLRDHRILVYGDDIVVPTAAYENVIDVLGVAGFVPNRKKSFGEGPFRESCGKHYYGGTDVTPIYVREAVSRLDRLFLLHNNLYRLFMRFSDVIADEAAARDLLLWVRSHAPEKWRKPRLPSLNAGDGAFVGTFEECTPRRAPRGWDGWRVETLQCSPVLTAPRGRYNLLLASLWRLEQRPDLSLPDHRKIQALRLGAVGQGQLIVPSSATQGKDALPKHLSQATGKVTWRISTQIVVSEDMGPPGSFNFLA